MANNESTIWQRFKQVTEYIPPNRRVYRSSAPNYGYHDDSQSLTEAAVDFLTLAENSISGIISFNEFEYTAVERGLLGTIQYLHLPVPDLTSPTLDQLQAAYNFVVNLGDDSGTLVHCGYGHGRTGTGITGIQLHTTRGANPEESLWGGERGAGNCVEMETQKATLRQLRDSFN